MVSPNGADVSTAAAQTRAVRPPLCAAVANSRSTSSILLTSVGTGVACAAGRLDAAGDAGQSVPVPGRENDVRSGARQGLRPWPPRFPGWPR